MGEEAVEYTNIVEIEHTFDARVMLTVKTSAVVISITGEWVGASDEHGGGSCQSCQSCLLI